MGAGGGFIGNVVGKPTHIKNNSISGVVQKKRDS